MERYYSFGGKPNPEFRYRVKVKDATDEMLNWCGTYPAIGSFERYYVEWTNITSGQSQVIFQFETERPALLFKLKYGDQ